MERGLVPPPGGDRARVDTWIAAPRCLEGFAPKWLAEAAPWSA